MGDKLIVGPVSKGLKTDVLPFNIDNDSFPTLINSYQWRGRIRRKRGTSLLTRLNRFFNSTKPVYGNTQTISLSSGSANILTGFGLESTGNIAIGISGPGGVIINDITSGNQYTEPTPADGTLLKNGSPDPGSTINYATGVITIVGGGADSINVSFNYTPGLPVLGEEDFEISSSQFPGTIGFDTTYSYNILTTFPYPNYDVSFYKNPPTGTYPAPYVQKTIKTRTSWNGQTYQQFWSVNYQGALWLTNGIDVPFTGSTISMQYAGPLTSPPLSAATFVNSTTMTFTIAGNPLVIGDFVFANEFTASGGGQGMTINFQTGYVTSSGNTFTVVFPNANITPGTYIPGILQYLTNRSSPTMDCLRFYDGDPTNGNVTNPTISGVNGWVNFMPPLSLGSYSISDAPQAIYYLVGARFIIPYKDRLLFLGPVIQTSTPGSAIYLQDTVIYSQNGTPYYTTSFTSPASNPTNILSLLVPVNQSALPTAWVEDQTGFGGYQSAGIDEVINTVTAIGDVLVVGFEQANARLIYTGNDITPFNFFLIDSELGSSSPFSMINMGRSVLTRGSRGFTSTTQEQSIRFDTDIIDEVFEINLTVNGLERFTAQRDFINEWVYFSYPGNSYNSTYPNTTLQYNYRDDSWAIFYETYTHYGQFRKSTGFTWQTVGLVYPTWQSWNVPWNAGSSTLLQPEVIAGNQQGFILVRDQGTGEGPSLSITSISAGVVVSPNHTLNNDDYIVISNCLGTVGTLVNGEIFSIAVIDANTFQLNPSVGTGSETYFGGGLITRMYIPDIQTKQFPAAWGMGRKTRIGVQRYLLTTTQQSQIQLLIFLSQNSAEAYNDGNIVPQPNVDNNSLIYSTTLFTCPESTNLGLSPANINLNMVTAAQQEQIWHRISTSLIGDTIQLGFYMTDSQMRDLEQSGTAFVITGATTSVQCILTCAGQFESGTILFISGVVGMTQLNGNYYQVITSSSTTVTINVNSSAFTAYVSGGLASPYSGINGFAEIELHGFILDITPSQELA